VTPPPSDTLADPATIDAHAPDAVDAVDADVAVFDDGAFVRDPIVAGGLFVDTSEIHGTGVFAARAFAPDEVIEQCPVLVVPPEQAERVAPTTFGDYVYDWEGGYALALGFGSLYNHSRSPAARYEMDYDLEEIHVIALRAIHPGDEITINYNGDPDDQTPVWFE
jgi:hypothetical protein